jgi:hypothetical protein
MLRALTLVLASAPVFAAPLAYAEGESRLRLEIDPSASVLSGSTDANVRLAQSVRDEHARRQHALVLRNVGIGLTVFGAVATIVGSALVVHGFHCIESSCTDEQSRSYDNQFYAGSSLVGIGQAAALVGAPLWAIGQKRAGKAKANLGLSASGARIAF